MYVLERQGNRPKLEDVGDGIVAAFISVALRAAERTARQEAYRSYSSSPESVDYAVPSDRKSEQ